MLMNARSQNRNSEFTVNAKLTADEDALQFDDLEVFDASAPEGVYTLNLANMYDQIVLRELLTITVDLV